MSRLKTPKILGPLRRQCFLLFRADELNVLSAVVLTVNLFKVISSNGERCYAPGKVDSLLDAGA